MFALLLYIELAWRMWRLFREHRHHKPTHRIPQGRGAHRYQSGDEARFNPYADAAYHTRTAVA